MIRGHYTISLSKKKFPDIILCYIKIKVINSISNLFFSLLFNLEHKIRKNFVYFIIQILREERQVS